MICSYATSKVLKVIAECRQLKSLFLCGEKSNDSKLDLMSLTNLQKFECLQLFELQCVEIERTLAKNEMSPLVKLESVTTGCFPVASIRYRYKNCSLRFKHSIQSDQENLKLRRPSLTNVVELRAKSSNCCK